MRIFGQDTTSGSQPDASSLSEGMQHDASNALALDHPGPDGRPV